MLICGVKASHDGAVALIDSDSMTLVGSIETEKYRNGPRRGPIRSSEMLVDMLGILGYRPMDVDRWVIDGWGDELRGYANEVEIGEMVLPVAPYAQSSDTTPPLHRYNFQPYTHGKYESYRHVEGHLASVYATRGHDDPVAVLVWDGAMFPQLYVVDGDVRHLCEPFKVRSCIYEKFGSNIPPFKPDDTWTDQQYLDEWNNNNAGKMMAFAGLGKVNDQLVVTIKDSWDKAALLPPDEPGGLYEIVKPSIDKLGVDGPSVFASFQQAVGEILIDSLYRVRHMLPDKLCFAGGAALNIKWNSMIRSSQLFDDVWVPPFPNDAGSAIGAAYASLMSRGVRDRLKWDVYTGPKVLPSLVPRDWTGSPCTIDELGALLADDGGPVTVVSGRAELGPRALGHRSIMAPATCAMTKDMLNDIKGRESYRPVAPMCLEERAPQIFDPGTPDPYMLFDHRVRDGWVDRIPAVLHLDGTARLQTVAPGSLAYEIVSAYEKRTGIPVLCNTSANYPGKGFFPDVASACKWGGTPFVWSEGVLYRRVG